MQNFLDLISEIDGKMIFSYTGVGIFIAWDCKDKFEVRSVHTGNVIDIFVKSMTLNPMQAEEIVDCWVEDHYAPYFF